MKSFRLFLLVGFVFLFSVNMIGDDQKNTSPDPMFAQYEEFLRNAEIGPLTEFRIGRRETYKAELNLDGEKRQGLFSPTDRLRGRRGLVDSYKYVIASYELDKLLGGNIVWPVVEREKDGRKGALQIFIEEPFLSEEDRRRRKMPPRDPMSFRIQMENIKLFSALVYSDWKLNIEDILILLDQDWRVIRVDLSQAFNTIPTNHLEYRIRACSKNYYDSLKNLQDSEIENTVMPYLNSREIEALLLRKNIILKRLDDLIVRFGEDTVLFD